MAAHHSRLAPARPTDPRSRRQPPEILVSALAAMLSVVAAVCLLAVTHALWALLVAVVVMLAATLLLTFAIGLQLGQSEQPERVPSRRSPAARGPADAGHPTTGQRQVTAMPVPSGGATAPSLPTLGSASGAASRSVTTPRGR
jgi:hypothetical protein